MGVGIRRFSVFFLRVGASDLKVQGFGLRDGELEATMHTSGVI